MKRVLIILAMLALLPTLAAATWCGDVVCGNDTISSAGDLDGFTLAQIEAEFVDNYIANTQGWTQFQTFVMDDGNTGFWTPWHTFDNDNDAANLKDSYVSGTATYTKNTDVTDESSEFDMAVFYDMTDTQFSYIVNTLERCASSHDPALRGWVCSRDGATITINDANSASDASARIGLFMAMASKSQNLNSSNRALALQWATDIADAMIAEEFVTRCQDSPLDSMYSTGQLCEWHLAGAAQAWGSGAVTQIGQQFFIGYFESQIQFFLAMYALTGDSTYDLHARYEAHQFLYSMQFDGTGFTMPVEDKNFYMVCSGSGVCTVDSQFDNGGFEDADAPRAWETCNNVDFATKTYARYGESLPSEFQALKDYCDFWAARVSSSSQTITTGSTWLVDNDNACLQIRDDGLCRVTVNSDDYRGIGWTSNMVAYTGNASHYLSFIEGPLLYYDDTNDYYTQGGGTGSPTDRSFGIYGQVRLLRSIRAATGFYDFLWNDQDFNYTQWSGATPEPPAATPPIISSVADEALSNSSARVTWTTDDSSNSTVFYGTTLSYGNSNGQATLLTSHSITLSGLQQNTTYFYYVSSSNAGGTNTSGNGDNTFNFTTDPTPPFACDEVITNPSETCTAGGCS